MSSPLQSRILKIRTVALLLILAAFASWRWWSSPSRNFPVEHVSWADNVPSFSSGGLIPEEQYSVANGVRQRTWRSVARVIVDNHAEQDARAYAFVGNSQGSVYTLRPAGLDSWEVAGEDRWAGDPHAYVSRQIPAPSLVNRGTAVRAHAPCEVGGRASFVRRVQ